MTTGIDPKTEKAARSFLSRIAERYDVSQAILYGSRARGTHHSNSDVDVAVILKGERQRFMSVKLNMSDIAFEVLLEAGLLISALPLWADEWERPNNYSNPDLLFNIDKEGIRL